MLKFGLLGRKLGHSYSKDIHSLLADYSYELFEVEENELEAFLHSGNIGGLNVTIPYKQTVIKWCSELSDDAKAIGSVNTLVFTQDGIKGYNTDYSGFLHLANKANINLKGKKVLVLGSGGTSRAAVYAALKLGAKECVVISRSGENNYDNLNLHSDADIIINTTPVGMFPNIYASPIDLKMFYNCEGVVDVIYNPIRTKLIMQAEELNIPCASGITMLVAQAHAAAELFIGHEIDRGLIDDITDKISRDKQNIVLIGMPGCGKSTIGKEIAKKLGRPFFDTDEMVELSSGMSIPKIFETMGESAFRDLEEQAVTEATNKSGAVISTGGGAVLREANRLHIKQNSRVYFIKRALDKLPCDGRPLSKNLQEMYLKREPIYMDMADAVIENDSSIAEAVRKIEEMYL